MYAADGAMWMVNESIRLSAEKNDPRYMMNFIKLHKLLYLGQCYHLITQGKKLFDANVVARSDGPYVENIHFVPAKKGFGVITTPFPDKDMVVPSYYRLETMSRILDQFGTLPIDELIPLTKNTAAYREAARYIPVENEQFGKVVIPTNCMANTATVSDGVMTLKSVF